MQHPDGRLGFVTLVRVPISAQACVRCLKRVVVEAVPSPLKSRCDLTSGCVATSLVLWRRAGHSLEWHDVAVQDRLSFINELLVGLCETPLTPEGHCRSGKKHIDLAALGRMM